MLGYVVAGEVAFCLGSVLAEVGGVPAGSRLHGAAPRPTSRNQSAVRVGGARRRRQRNQTVKRITDQASTHEAAALQALGSAAFLGGWTRDGSRAFLLCFK